jgi:hypothetical protein
MWSLEVDGIPLQIRLSLSPVRRPLGGATPAELCRVHAEDQPLAQALVGTAAVQAALAGFQLEDDWAVHLRDGRLSLSFRGRNDAAVLERLVSRSIALAEALAQHQGFVAPAPGPGTLAHAAAGGIEASVVAVPALAEVRHRG